MRKISFPAGRQAEVADAPVPVPGSGQLLVRTKAVGVGVGLVRMLRAADAVRPGGELRHRRHRSLLGGLKSVIGFSIGLVNRTQPDLVAQRRTELWDLLAAAG